MTQGDEELAAWRAKVTVAYIMVKRCLPKKNNRKKCEELCHHTKNDMGKTVRKPEFLGTE